jgi:hypothetical protein
VPSLRGAERRSNLDFSNGYELRDCFASLAKTRFQTFYECIKSDGLAKKQVLPRRVLRKPFHSFDKIKKKAAPEEPPCWKCLDVRENEDQ